MVVGLHWCMSGHLGSNWIVLQTSIDYRARVLDPNTDWSALLTNTARVDIRTWSIRTKAKSQWIGEILPRWEVCCLSPFEVYGSWWLAQSRNGISIWQQQQTIGKLQYKEHCLEAFLNCIYHTCTLLVLSRVYNPLQLVDRLHEARTIDLPRDHSSQVYLMFVEHSQVQDRCHHDPHWIP